MTEKIFYTPPWKLVEAAEFVVKAVNSHYELLEALKNMVCILNGFDYDQHTVAYNAIEKAREAIEKAKGD